MTAEPQPAPFRRAIPILLIALFLVAVLLRVGAALWLVNRNRQAGVRHEFADSELYWKLGLQIAAGKAFDDGRRQVLRTPGYPLFLAGCIRLFGNSDVAARHMQAAVGAGSCVLLFFLLRRLVDARVAWIAAGLAAVYPFAIFLSAVLLSETLFATLFVLQLLVLARALESIGRSAPWARQLAWSALVGLCGAAATLVRPSWILATPGFALLQLCGLTGTGSKTNLMTGLALLAAFSLGMAPWWIRNWNVTGHFVPTTLWVGASLYDGLNPRATGASDMEFMNRPHEFGLNSNLDSMNEWEQDDYLRRKALEFARANPARVLELAGIKFARFWNPLPNAAGWGSWPMRVLSMLTSGPVFVLATLGAWRLRRRWQVFAILAGPVLYFTAIHLVFASSIRYRESAMLPVLGLVALALTPRDKATRRK